MTTTGTCECVGSVEGGSAYLRQPCVMDPYVCLWLAPRRLSLLASFHPRPPLDCMIRNTTLSSRQFLRFASSAASNATKAASDKASKTASKVSDISSDLASDAKTKVNEVASAASNLKPEGSLSPSSVIGKASSEASTGTSEAAGKVRLAAREFTEVRPSSKTVFNEAVSDAKSTAEGIADIAKGAFAAVTGSNSNSPSPTGSNVHSRDSNNNDKMTSSDEKPNASGLLPSESMKLPTIQPSKEDQPILDAVKSFYEAKHKNEDFNIFSEKAIFKDPLSIAEGLDRIKVQYNGLAALFPKAYVDKFDSLEVPKQLGSHTLLVNQDIRYYRSKEQSDAEPTKKLNSLIAITKGNDGKVISLVEEWNHSTLQDSNNAGFLGMLNEGRKKAFAIACMPFISHDAPGSK